MILYLREDFASKEVADGFGRDRMESVVNRYTDALLTLAHAEGAAKLHLLAKAVLGDQILKLLDYLARALDVA